MLRVAVLPRGLVLALGLVATARSLPAQIVEFPVPTAASRPYTIVAGPDGNLWFTESDGNRIGRITPSGVITEFPFVAAGSGPYGICVGRDGNLWFTERFANQIGRLNPTTLQFQEYPIPSFDSQPWEICAGADGLLWFTEETATQIASIHPLGPIVEYTSSQAGCCFQTGIAAGPAGNRWYTIEIGDQIGQIDASTTFVQHQIQSVQVLPWDIAPGPDGNMWFTELAGRAVGRITPAGVITEFPIAGAFSGIAGIATGSNGLLYFTENDTNQISSIDLSGNVLQNLPTSDRPLSVCNGPDGNIWFVTADGNKIGRWTVAQPGIEHVLSMDSGWVPVVKRVQPGETVQWTFNGPSAHSVTDTSGINLFASGPKEPVSFFTHTFPAAGAYAYKDISPAFTRAGIDVRVGAPTTGAVGVSFTLVWAVPAVPAGFIEDVQVWAPGAPGFTALASSTASSAPYTPTVPGLYQFRARLREVATGKASFFSRPTSVQVN
jgi:virginiamycin B lyase